MRIKTWAWLMPAVLAAGLVGCSRQGNYTDDSAINNYSAHRGAQTSDTTRAYQTQQLYGNVIHDNAHLYYNQYLTDQIAGMYGISTAIVMTTDKYAYVAVMLDNSGIGTHGGDSRLEVNNAGTVRGLYNVYSTQNDGASSNNVANGVNSYYTVSNHNDLSHGIKQKIAQKIRYLQPSILDVYISANRDFINSMNNLAQESWKGKPLDPYVGDFNRIVTNVFGTGQWTMNE
ncbi:YhcN/YlaJ family sporulation lipoprotein [Paenibacillus chartarius]|uniref:YhcN/YlaJ family sporulation lipoprotein n=1 Tax=Paenibacillus chartarius TaxID=747481 RepID=A0ABV6DGB3_9BACL